MALILCLETATRNCSVALIEHAKVIAEKSFCDTGYSHAEQLHPFIQEVFSKTHKTLSDLQAVAVSSGPGSYTGLRIGVSAAKGLAYALDIPLIAIPTLSSLTQYAIAENNISGSDWICPMIDARRLEVYTALFDMEGKQLTDTEAKIIDANSFSEELDKRKIWFIGDGSEKCSEIIKHHNACFLNKTFPEAPYMALLVEAKFANNEFEDLAYFEPNYFKSFVAGKPKKS